MLIRRMQVDIRLPHAEVAWGRGYTVMRMVHVHVCCIIIGRHI